MHVSTGHHDAEVRLTIEAAVELVNALGEHEPGAFDVRGLLADHGFTRASAASAASVSRVEHRMRDLAQHLYALTDQTVSEAVGWINDELAAVPIEPSLTSHDGAPLHIHWTPARASFDDQVLADVLMAIALEMVDHGIDRFGRCAADDCDHLFYDATRNRSRRFCADPRCASRTHTASHRARQRRGRSGSARAAG